MKTNLILNASTLLLTTLMASSALAQTPANTIPATQSTAPNEAPTILQMTVRRVLVDVVVTNAKGSPVSGLTQGDFRVTEDGTDQKIVAFDAVGFSNTMDYVPPTLPPQPLGTYINLPPTPEKGPLYVLLYDLVNMDSADQMNSPMDHSAQLFARRQLIRFIANKPAGTRFAIFVRSDGLHLVQPFTADKTLLFDAIDPHHPRPHLPTVFLNGENFGRGDRISALDTLHSIATYLDGLSGRKNLIWFSSQFPLSLFAADSDGPNFQEETKETLDLLAHNQIALYPVDGRGVPYQDSHAQLANSPHSDTVTSPQEAGRGASAGSGAVGNSPSTSSSFVQGSSVVVDSFNTMDGIAQQTGGEAFYSDNDVAKELVKATDAGQMYYTLTYVPSNPNYDAKVRKIHIDLARKGYTLSYRRSYYGIEMHQAEVGTTEDKYLASVTANHTEVPIKDSLAAYMEHGAPEEHQLVFVVQTKLVGAPLQGTPEQMADLATEPAYFKSRRRSRTPLPLAPLPLQKVMLNFNIPTRQFKDENVLNLELAAAAYDSEGRLMNAFVRIAKKDLQASPDAPDAIPFFRVEHDLEVPPAAASLRLAVRDVSNNRMGAMEIALPLPPTAR